MRARKHIKLVYLTVVVLVVKIRIWADKNLGDG